MYLLEKEEEPTQEEWVEPTEEEGLNYTLDVPWVGWDCFKNFSLTHHAKERMRERKISREAIKICLKYGKKYCGIDKEGDKRFWNLETRSWLGVMRFTLGNLVVVIEHRESLVLSVWRKENRGVVIMLDKNSECVML
tara:strand:- start:43 stop:453 length:411 start_codon:yes stop_codon:yes gene_type:complete